MNATKEYSPVVQEIHNEFFNAGDKLLATAKAFLNTPTKVSDEKVSQLNEFGFTKSKDVVYDLENEIQTTKEKIEAINYFRTKYPNYKFIDDKAAKKICKKYGLVLGEVSLFKGFVPQKNIDDITLFFKRHENLKTIYIKKSGVWGIEQTITEKDFNEGVNKVPEVKEEKPVSIISEPNVLRSPSPLMSSIGMDFGNTLGVSSIGANLETPTNGFFYMERFLYTVLRLFNFII